MPYLKPNAPYEDNRTREEVLEYAFSALKRNHDAFSSSSLGKSSSSSFVEEQRERLTDAKNCASSSSRNTNNATTLHRHHHHDRNNNSNSNNNKANVVALRTNDDEYYYTNGGDKQQQQFRQNDDSQEEGSRYWRIFATSDVHADMQANKDWVVRFCQNCTHPEPGTVLLVAGDVATDVQKVIDALKLFKMRYQEVFYCVGNHELWSPGRGEMGDSVDKFVVIMDAVTSIGVRCTPTVFTHQGVNELGMRQTKRILVVPMLSWYTETFKGGTRPFTQMEVHFDGACIWPPAIGDPKDKRNSHPATLDEFWRRLGKMSLESFLPKSLRVSNTTRNASSSHNINEDDDVNAVDCGNEVAFLATFGHFVPLPDLFNGTPFIEKVVGSESLGEDILALRDECDCKSTPGSGRSSPAARFKKGRFDYNSTIKHIHVFGHSHLNVDVEIDGSRWYQRAVGYPTDRGPMPPEMPRQIYPA